MPWLLREKSEHPSSRSRSLSDFEIACTLTYSCFAAAVKLPWATAEAKYLICLMFNKRTLDSREPCTGLTLSHAVFPRSQSRFIQLFL